MQLQSPDTFELLHYNKVLGGYSTKDSKIWYPIINNVIRFLVKSDDFYEGSYLNRIKFIPKSESIFHTWPLWLISNGSVWEVRKQFPAGSTLLELGCAGGVDYFANRYNMIGLDLSFQSLQNLNGYKYALQADATNIPLADLSVDGIISSYFWEHIPTEIKDKMLQEFKRVLKPGGKLVFLYDVETANSLVSLLKSEDIQLYKKLFIEKDGHLGYETPGENMKRFKAAGYVVEKHFGMERTWMQSNSVFEKFSQLHGWKGLLGRVGNLTSKSTFTNYLHSLLVRITDATVGRFISTDKSRIIISVLKSAE